MKAELLAYANNVNGVGDYELAQASGHSKSRPG